MLKIRDWVSLKSDFARNFLVLMSGTAISQAIPVLISPILTRIYSPNDIGVFAIFFSASSVISTVLTGRYELAILLPKKDYVARYLVLLTIFLSTALAIIFIIALFFYKDFFSNLLEVKGYKDYLFLLPIMALSFSYFQVLNFWLNRIRAFKDMSKGRIYQSVAMSIYQIGFYSFGGLSLIVGRIVGQIYSVIYFLRKTDFRLSHLHVKFINFKMLKKIALKYNEFPIYSMPNALLNVTSNNLPNFILAKLFSLKETAYYSWSSRMILTPMSLITSSMQQIFFQEASELNNEGKSVYPIVLRTYKKLFIIGIVPFIVVGILSPWIFSLVFGETWRIAGVYTQYLTPWYFLTFLNSPITSIVFVKQKQPEFLIIEVVLFILRVAAFALGFFVFNSAVISIIMFGVVGVLYNLFLVFYLLHISK